MDGEHIEQVINGWISPEFVKQAIIELGRMREELYVLRQLAGGLTPRAPDAGDSAAFLNMFYPIFDLLNRARRNPPQRR